MINFAVPAFVPHTSSIFPPPAPGADADAVIFDIPIAPVVSVSVDAPVFAVVKVPAAGVVAPTVDPLIVPPVIVGVLTSRIFRVSVAKTIDGIRNKNSIIFFMIYNSRFADTEKIMLGVDAPIICTRHVKGSMSDAAPLASVEIPG